MSQKQKSKEHYVDNKLFLQAMTDWRLKYTKAKEKKQQDVKAKVIANSGVELMMDSLEGDDAVYKSQMLDFLQKNIKESEKK